MVIQNIAKYATNNRVFLRVSRTSYRKHHPPPPKVPPLLLTSFSFPVTEKPRNNGNESKYWTHKSGYNPPEPLNEIQRKNTYRFQEYVPTSKIQQHAPLPPIRWNIIETIMNNAKVKYIELETRHDEDILGDKLNTWSD